LILALANPIPEIMPEDAKAARPDAIIATGRSDYPNQINNVLCFPFIFRGALDVGATTINEEMKLACVNAIADIATAEVSDIVATVYAGESLNFGPNYILPKPFDPRLIYSIAPAVAQAAMDSGVATRNIEDLTEYCELLSEVVFRSGAVMRPLFEIARKSPKRILYTEGENERVLRAVQELIHDKLARPILIGREEVVRERLKAQGLRCKPDVDFELIDPQEFSDYGALAEEYHSLMGRSGINPEAAESQVRSDSTVLGALLLRRGDADALISGPLGVFHSHLRHIRDIVGRRPETDLIAGMQLLLLEQQGGFFIADTSINDNPDAEIIAKITRMAASEVERFGIKPKVALLSHSNFGARDTADTVKLRQALRMIRAQSPELEIDGEMQADAALSQAVRNRILPSSSLKGQANLLIMPNLDAASICFNALKELGHGVSVGPIVLGLNKPAHVLSRTVTTRGIVNLSVYSVAQSQMPGDQRQQG